MNNLKCIKNECNYYFESDVYTQCIITGQYITKNSICKGIIPAKKLAEEKTCEVSKIINEITKLKELENFVKNHQEG